MVAEGSDWVQVRHKVKGFGVDNEAEIDVFLELLLFL